MVKQIIFLDFDGVMDTAYYVLVLVKRGETETDRFGPVFSPTCITALKYIFDNTWADIVVSSTWKYFMNYEDLLDMWHERNLPGFELTTLQTTYHVVAGTR